MRSPDLLIATLLVGVISLPAMAQSRPIQWGVQGSLGLSTGDLKDTANSGPCFSLGGHMDYTVMKGHTLRARVDGMFFQSTNLQSRGTSDGNPWLRSLDTKVRGWSLGAEYLLQPFPRESRLTFGAGLHLVRWSVNNTSTLELTVGTNSGASTGTLVESSTPSWTKVGISLLVAYRITPRLSAEARVLSSGYGWEGERVHLGQIGLAWTF